MASKDVATIEMKEEHVNRIIRIFEKLMDGLKKRFFHTVPAEEPASSSTTNETGDKPEPSIPEKERYELLKELDDRFEERVKEARHEIVVNALGLGSLTLVGLIGMGFSFYEFTGRQMAQAEKMILSSVTEEAIFLAAKESFINQFEAEASEVAHQNVAGALTNLKIGILTGQIKPTGELDPTALRYDIALLERKYLLPLAQGKVHRKRAHALMHVTRALASLAYGNLRAANHAVLAAQTIDPTFPETYYILAMIEIVKLSNDPTKIERRQIMRLAHDHFLKAIDLSNSENEKSVYGTYATLPGMEALAHWASEDLDEAVRVGEADVLDPYDARAFYRLGHFLIGQYRNAYIASPPHGVVRERGLVDSTAEAKKEEWSEILKNFRLATRDPDFLLAINTWLWLITHHPPSEDKVVSFDPVIMVRELDEQDRSYVKKLYGQLMDEIDNIRDAKLLNTLSEVAYSMEHYSEALEISRKAVLWIEQDYEADVRLRQFLIDARMLDLVSSDREYKEQFFDWLLKNLEGNPDDVSACYGHLSGWDSSHKPEAFFIVQVLAKNFDDWVIEEISQELGNYKSAVRALEAISHAFAPDPGEQATECKKLLDMIWICRSKAEGLLKDLKDQSAVTEFEELFDEIDRLVKPALSPSDEAL